MTEPCWFECKFFFLFVCFCFYPKWKVIKITSVTLKIQLNRLIIYGSLANVFTSAGNARSWNKNGSLNLRGKFDKCISIHQSSNKVLMLSLSCFSFPVFYLGEFLNSDFSFKFALSTSWISTPKRMSHCLRKCQAEVSLQVLIEHLFYSSSSYINIYFSFIVDVFHLFEVSLWRWWRYYIAVFHLLCVT